MKDAHWWLMDMYGHAEKACDSHKSTDIGECVSRSVRTPIRTLQLKNGVLTVNIRLTAWDIQATVSYNGLAVCPVMDNSTKEAKVYWPSLSSWPENLQFGSYNENHKKFSCVFYMRDWNDMARELLPFIRSL